MRAKSFTHFYFSELQLSLLANNPSTDQVILSRSPLVPRGPSKVCPVKLWVLVHLSPTFDFLNLRREQLFFRLYFSCNVETSSNYSDTLTDLHGTPCHDSDEWLAINVATALEVCFCI